MKALLGYKVGMTQIIEEDGRAVPATVLQAGPCFVTQVKTVDHDGYEALQLGFDETEEKRLTRGELGHLGRLEKDDVHPQRKPDRGIPALRHLREVRTKTVGEYKIGQQLTVEQFEKGERVDVTGKSKGRGFTGVVKRHGFRGGPKTHGQSDRWRAPGSIGATSGMARVIKGMRMAGRSGNETVTSQNLEVVRIDSERNLIAVKGSVPGAKGSLVLIRDARKG
ncbi:MAG TPA: 50S ribosomal protein L3 [Candidatus Sulfomarinibacteraceae bacterium]|nr:50S ribosomal protein L3 [Candidatus Sulfomarinibacteraceae bacterium]